jgi:DNA-binding MarR family transcriptional regulator
MELSLLDKAILAALARGIDSFSGLRKLVNVEEEALRRAIEKLQSLGLVKVERRGLLIKRDVLVLTERGLEEAEKALRELEEVARRVEERFARVEEGRIPAQRAIEGISDVMMIAPLLAWLGFLDLALLAPLAAMLAEDVESGAEEYEASEELDVGDIGDYELA